MKIEVDMKQKVKELRKKKKKKFKNVKKNISIYYMALVLPPCTTPSALIEDRCTKWNDATLTPSALIEDRRKSFFQPPTKYEEIESLENIILRINIFNELKKRENLLLKRKRSFIKRNRKRVRSRNFKRVRTEKNKRVRI